MRLARLALGAVALSLGATASAGPGSAPSVAAVAKIWADREAKIKTGRIAIRMVETQGTLLHITNKWSKHKPTGSVTVTRNCVLTFDQGKVRYESDGAQWSDQTGAVEPYVTVNTFDGKRSGVTVLKSSGVDHPEVTIGPLGAAYELKSFQLNPIWSSVRGSMLAADDTLPLAKFAPTGRTVAVSDRPCFEYGRTRADTGAEERLYLDAERALQIVRRTETNKGVVQIQQDVTFREDPLLGWAPHHWDYACRTPTGATLVAGRIEVKELSLNPVVDDSQFAPVLPPGARVADFMSGKEVQYGVKPDGGKGHEVPAQPGRAIDYSELWVEPAPNRWRWLVILPIAAAGLAAAVLIYRRVARRGWLAAPNAQ